MAKPGSRSARLKAVGHDVTEVPFIPLSELNLDDSKRHKIIAYFRLPHSQDLYSFDFRAKGNVEAKRLDNGSIVARFLG